MSLLAETIGGVAATLTTLCWLPQAFRIIRTRDTRAISIWAQAALTAGTGLWFIYGLMVGSVPLMAANAVTCLLTGSILALKLRYG